MSDLSIGTLPSAAVSTSFLGAPAESLRDRAPGEVAQEFESIFLAMLLKEMRQSELGDGLFPGDSSDTYGGIFDMYLGRHLAQNGGIGLAESIAKSMASSGQVSEAAT